MQILNARLRDHDGLVDIEVADGCIATIRPVRSRTTDTEAGAGATASVATAVPGQGGGGGADASAASGGVFDADGRLVTPQFVENHIHLDYAKTAGEPRDNESGTLFEAIEIWRDRKAAGLQQHERIKENARAAARAAVSHGVGHIRTHVDVTDPQLTAFYALRELKEEIAGWCDLQLVAFPQNGIYAFDGGDALVARALDEGADVVGGIPHLEPGLSGGERSIAHLFDLAEKHDALIDMHCDEIDDPQSRFVDEMAAQTRARGLQGRVTVSHAVAMGYYAPGYLARLLPKLVEAELGFAIAPNENLQLQGRGFGQPTPRGVAPVRDLVEHGLSVAFCQDSMEDPWYPVGAGDPVRNLDSGLHVSHMLTAGFLDTALDFITSNPARNLGLTDFGVREGGRADLLVLDAASDREVVREHPDVLLSLHGGVEVFRQEPRRVTWGAHAG